MNMKSLVFAVMISLMAFAGPSFAHCGGCGVGGEATEEHAADGHKDACASCCEEKGNDSCAEACAEGTDCADCGKAKGEEGCTKDSGK